jgi:hypothetical protein
VAAGPTCSTSLRRRPSQRFISSTVTSSPSTPPFGRPALPLWRSCRPSPRRWRASPKSIPACARASSRTIS